MASVDVVELMLHTQIPTERLVSWIDQAILHTSLGAAGDGVTTLGKLRTLGLRTATQAVGEYLYGSDEDRKSLRTAAGTVRIESLVFALQKEVNFDLVRAWRQV
jgi:hypothetical protein